MSQDPEEPGTSRSDRVIAAGLFLLAFVAFCWIYGGWGANQEANFALARALAERLTTRVDQFTHAEGDVARGVDGGLYINKPPGLSALAAVPYAALYTLTNHGVTLHDHWQTNKRLVTIAICGVSGALIGPVLYLYGRRRMGRSRSAAALVSISITFGTIVFAYSTMLFAHVPSALFLLLAMTLLKDRPLAAGLAAGMAGACFYISGVAGCVLVLLAWWDSPKKAAWFIAGGLPFALALAGYHWINFGSPYTTPVATSSEFTEQGLLLGVFGKPRLASLWGITFSEYRGLFICSPILLFAVAGAVMMLRRRRMLAELSAVAAISLMFIVVISSFNGWHGGYAFGPRYLVPIVPLLGIPMMFAATRLRGLWLLVGSVSIAINLAATAVDPMTPEGLARPLTRYVFPTLFTGRVPLEAGEKVYPPCEGIRCTSNQVSLAQNAENLGEPLFGKGRAVSILPLALWIGVGSILMLRFASREDGIDCAIEPSLNAS